jgi:hypothetical protein
VTTDFTATTLGNGIFSVSEDSWRDDARGEGGGAGVVRGVDVEHAWLPQEQHWQGVASLMICGERTAIPCVTRRRHPNRMFKATRIKAQSTR